MKSDFKVVLIRHGITASNDRKEYIGCRTDVPLSQKGISLAQSVQKETHILVGTPENIYSSPMTRCMQTAKILWPEGNLRTVEDLREMDFGDFEGKNYFDLSDNPEYQKWIDSGGTAAFPNGEGREEFSLRTMNALKQILNDCRPEKKNCDVNKSETDECCRDIVIVCHGGTIMAAMSSIFGGDYYDYIVSNLNGYILELSYNDGNIFGKSYSGFIPGNGS